MRLLSVIVLTCALLFAGCSKKDEKFYQNAAKESLQKQDIKAAVVNYEKIAEEFPESPAASEALYNIGRIYQNKMDKDVEANASLQKAISYFQKIIEKYPHSKEAPTALFMTGFIQANELKNYDAARKSYNQFLKDYPQHEMATAAQQELDFMGVSPDEIISKKLAGKK